MLIKSMNESKQIYFLKCGNSLGFKHHGEEKEMSEEWTCKKRKKTVRKGNCENNFGNKWPVTQSIYLLQELLLWGEA